MEPGIDAGRLDKRLEVLELRKRGDGAWEWVTVGKTWAQVTIQAKKNLFSNVGIGARDAELVLRRRRLDLHQALRWRGQHYFLTSIVPRGRGHLDVSAALVAPVECRKDADRSPAGCTFPGVLTEKYVGHEQLDPLAVVTTDFVLVTPKAIALDPGSWVICGGRYYRVLVPHELDEYKNEYEIRRKEDC